MHTSEFIPKWMPRLFSEAAPQELREELASIMSDFHPIGYRLMALSSAGVDTRDLLPNIRVPTLLVWGEEDERAVDRGAPVPRCDPRGKTRDHPRRGAREQPRATGPVQRGGTQLLSLARSRIMASDRSRASIRVELVHTYPVSVSEGFAYITDLDNWARYWPGFVRVHNPTRAKWRDPGDTVTLVMRFLAREVELNMTLEEFRKDALVRYTSRHGGLPDARHERHFRADPKGFEYRQVVAFEPREGLAGLLDRVFVKRAVRRALSETVENLDSVFRQTHVQATFKDA
jgi:hypothetical protein